MPITPCNQCPVKETCDLPIKDKTTVDDLQMTMVIKIQQCGKTIKIVTLEDTNSLDLKAMEHITSGLIAHELTRGVMEALEIE